MAGPGTVGAIIPYGSQSAASPAPLGTFAKHPIALAIDLLNGTVASHAAAVDVTVHLTNVTTGTVQSATTGISGTVVFDTYAGWYRVGGSASGRIGLEQEMFFASSRTLVEYMVPNANATLTIGNGPPASDTGNFWLQPYPDWSGPVPGIEVDLLNESHGGALLAFGVTGNNGTIGFKHLDVAFHYNFIVCGSTNNVTGIDEGMGSTLWGAPGGIIIAPGNTVVLPNIHSYTGGTAHATAGTTGYVSSWPSTVGPVTVSNGIWYIGGALSLTSGTLTFDNVTLYMNGSGVWYIPSRLVLVNSTMILLNMNPYMFNFPVSATDSVIIGCDVPGEYGPYLRGFAHSYFNSSALAYYWQDYGSFATSGEFRNSLILNTSLSGNSTLMGMDFSRVTMYGTSIVDQYINMTSSLFVANETLVFGHSCGLISTYGTWSDSVVRVVGTDQFNAAYENSTAATFFLDDGTLEQSRLENSATQVRSQFTIQNITNTTITANMTQMLPYSQLAHFQEMLFYLDPHGEFVHNYVSGWVVIWPSNHTKFVGNYFTNQSDIGTSQISLVPQADHLLYDVTITNNTFGGWYTDANLMAASFGTTDPTQWGGSTEVAGASGVNVPGPHAYLAFSNITYDTFYPFPGMGPGSTVGCPGDADIYGWFTNVAHSVFYNNQSYGPYAYQDLQVCPSVSIFVSPGNYQPYHLKMNITDDYFLNLNSNMSFMGEGQASFTGPPYSPVHLSSDHYYYTNSTPLNPTAPGLGWSYKAVVNTSVFTNPAQLVSNTSTETPVSYGGRTWVPGPTGDHLWVGSVSPDVNVSNGTPVISYAVGLAAGPQPNFYWGGASSHEYNYSERVEPSYIEAAVNSSNAPVISLGLQGQPGLALLDVYNLTTGSLRSETYVTVPVDGVYNATFFPANESSGVIISLVPESSPLYHGNLSGLIILGIGVTVVAGFVVYVTLGRKRRGAWER